jgi:hypothetical protein
MRNQKRFRHKGSVMLLSNNKIMLFYGFDKEEINIEDIIKKLDLSDYKIIYESMAKMKVKDILNSLKTESYNCKLPKEKLILFNNFEDEQLKDAIDIIRSNINPMPILAVATENSVEWTFEYLLEHLMEEREWFKKHQV